LFAARENLMAEQRPQDVTRLLQEWSKGNKAVLNDLVPIIYAELHRRAELYMRGERPNHTLQPTALINEAYLRLINYREMRWQNRAHFFAVAAQAMRRILVDHARRRKAEKRGDAAYTLSLDEAFALPEKRDIDLVALDDAINDLAAIDPQKSRMVELRFFSGLTIEETAAVMGVAPDTVRRHWNSAKAWLHREIQKGR
jgi:RNA polymerase sigma factor (TIGR02999 family)